MASGKSDNSSLFDRRTIIVLVCLVAAMTVTSGMLLMLQPRPIAPAGRLTLSVIESNPQGLEQIYQLKQDPVQTGWQSIVIHHSGQPGGSAASLGRQHQRLGYGGLGWHFVIGNGNGMTDGLIEEGYRWTNQLPGYYIPGAVSICLIGNGDRNPPTEMQMEQLIRLVRSLQMHLGIPASRVRLHNEWGDTTGPGRLFPNARFRSSLIDNPVAAVNK